MHAPLLNYPKATPSIRVAFLIALSIHIALFEVLQTYMMIFPITASNSNIVCNNLVPANRSAYLKGCHASCQFILSNQISC